MPGFVKECQAVFSSTSIIALSRVLESAVLCRPPVFGSRAVSRGWDGLSTGNPGESPFIEPGTSCVRQKKENIMKRSNFFAAVAVIGLMAGCSSPQDKAAKADAEMKEKRMQLADEYQTCTQKAAAYEEAVKAGKGNDVKPADQVQMSQCDEIMKTMEALK
jgi:outer membrane murein-binding lipoprotein Lpp